MRADKVVEKEEDGNQIVGRSKGKKPCFVSSLKLLVKALNEIVGNVIVKAFKTDALNSVQRHDGHSVGGRITVGGNGTGSSQGLHRVQYGKSLRAVPVAVKMEAENKASLAVQNEPKGILPALYFNKSFLSVPLVRVEIERRNEL